MSEGGPQGPSLGNTDAASLLIELGRAVKACRFYDSGHPTGKAALDRSFHAFRAGLERVGSIAFQIEGASFCVAGHPALRGHTLLEEFALELTHRGVQKLAIGSDLTREAFDALVGALALDGDELVDAGGLEHVLASLSTEGVRVNEAPEAAMAEVSPPPPAPMAAAQTPAEAVPPPTVRFDPAEDPDLPMPKVQTTGIDPLNKLRGLLEEPADEGVDGALRPEPEGDAGAELMAQLRTLDECRDDVRYAELLREVSVHAERLDPNASGEEGYRAIMVLANHAVESQRGERQRALAEEALFQIARGDRLQEVMTRACETPPNTSVRATQILLQLGAHCMPALLDSLLEEADPERRGQLNAVLIAMGEKALPEVKESLRHDDVRRVRLATRLAGEMQNPACVPYLAELLHDLSTPLDLVREAAKALVRIGCPSAVTPLADAVRGTRAELASAVAFCLGATGSPRALEVLTEALRRALGQGDDALARECVRALGKLGHPDAVPVLDELISKRSFLGRRRLRELQLAAVAALGRVPGSQAAEALERLASGRGDAQLKRAAAGALSRRSGASAT
jgi:HEAT repeat protein